MGSLEPEPLKLTVIPMSPLVGFAVATVVRAPRGRAPILAKLVPPASLLLAACGAVVVWLFLFGSFGRLAALATSGPVRTAEETEGNDAERNQSADQVEADHSRYLGLFHRLETHD